jgi:hypothetical protein
VGSLLIEANHFLNDGTKGAMIRHLVGTPMKVSITRAS